MKMISAFFIIVAFAACSSNPPASDPEAPVASVEPVADADASPKPSGTFPIAEPAPVDAADPAPVTTGDRPEGEACTKGSDCQSGVCEGEGCGEDEGKCMPKNRVCTRDLRSYCGCDGKTFMSSGSCPGRTFKNRGSCP